jgi:type II secretory pathway pseudopilin PulG
MNLPSSPRQRTTARMAFTLVELLVVIAIIIVLASLLLAAVFKALDLANEASTRTDITQIGAAVQSFQTKYQVNYIPSRIRLREIVNYAGNFMYDINNPNPAIAGYERDSADYLQRVWPRLSGAQITLNGQPASWIDWNGDGMPDSQPGVPPNFGNGLQDPSLYVDLEGEQCLAFFLGGIPQFNGNTFTVTGFSTNASNPAQPGGDRVPPFFDFKSNRLVQWPNTAPLFPSYLDGYGKTPYAYFSSYKGANGYNRYASIPNPYLPPPNPVYPNGSRPYPAQLYYSDCQALRFPPDPPLPAGVLPAPQGVWPYAQTWGPTIQYWNPQTFQIISAGKNTQFGLGTYPPGDPNYSYASSAFTAGGAAQYYPTGDNGKDLGTWGYDDIANFYDRLLGVPTQ